MTSPETRKRWRDKQRKAGLCVHCGKEPLVGNGGYGLVCLKKRREAARKKYGLKPWGKERKSGPVPIELRPAQVALYIKRMRKYLAELERSNHGKMEHRRK